MSKARDTAINRIAREALGLETLEARNMDSLDFHEHAVWSIKEALERAYEAGRKSASRTAGWWSPRGQGARTGLRETHLLPPARD